MNLLVLTCNSHKEKKESIIKKKPKENGSVATIAMLPLLVSRQIVHGDHDFFLAKQNMNRTQTIQGMVEEFDWRKGEVGCSR